MGKKNSLLLFGLIASYNFLHAQVKPADSLHNLLVSHTQEDTIRVNLLNDLAYELRRPKPESTDSLIKLSVSLAGKLNYAKGKGYALAIQGSRFYTILKYKEADSVFSISKQLLESVKDRKDEAYLLRSLGNMKMDEGNYAASLDNFLAGLKMAQEAGDIKQEVEIGRTIGYLYNVLGEYEKAIPYQTDALKHAESIDYKIGMSGAYNAIGKTYKTQGNYPASLDAYTKGLRIDEQLKDSNGISIDYGNIGDVYERMGNYPEAFSHIKVYLDFLWGSHRLEDRVSWGEWVLGKAFTHSGDPAKGLQHAKYSLEQANKVGWRLYLREITQLIAESAAELKQWDTAYKYQVLSSNYKDSLTGQEIARKTTMLQANFELDKKQAEIALLTKDKQLQIEENRREKIFLFALLGGLASLIVFAVVLYRNNRQKQKANLLLQKQKEEIDSKASNVELLGEIGRKITSSLSVETIIGTVYDNVNSLMDASVFGIGIYNDALKAIEFPATYENGQALPFYSNSINDENRFAVLCFIRREEYIIGDLEKEYKDYMQHIPRPSAGKPPVSLIYLPLKVKDNILGVITVQSFQKNAFSDYHLYMLRTIAIYAAIALENAESFKKLNLTVDSLKKTQKQLIQSEKMASLGELTAGIAHEIQNPLNFVNNFSELSTELVDEMNEELAKGNEQLAIGNMQQAIGNMQTANEIAKDLKQNLEKINHHGKRAGDIVKGMLQHSRTSSGQKELTDINALADEYLRLAYHGLRAKDKSFNATMKTDFDESLSADEAGIGSINIIPQDIGRVILNLITNAFYATSEKKKESEIDYEPTVTVSTSRSLSLGEGRGEVKISVKDNGPGIPQKILNKIFQPFFTTKPTGQGTGLGLSLSYDIVKAHGGELKVETKEGEGSEFIIQLPVT